MNKYERGARKRMMIHPPHCNLITRKTLSFSLKVIRPCNNHKPSQYFLPVQLHNHMIFLVSGGGWWMGYGKDCIQNESKSVYIQKGS